MDKTIYNFTFCALDLAITKDQKTQMLVEIKSVSNSYWYHDKFRGCYILPLFNGDGTTGAPKDGILRSKGTMKFTEAGEQCPTIKNIICNNVFSFMNPVGRMSVLKTIAGDKMNIHTDSSEQLIGSRQHKFRIALTGETEKLYFLDENKNKIYVPSYYNSYVIDGTHPHAIDIGEEKITICIGTPWTGEPNPIYEDLIYNSPFKMQVNRPLFEKQWECV